MSIEMKTQTMLMLNNYRISCELVLLHDEKDTLNEC